MRSSTLFAPLLFAATGLAQAVEEGIAPSDAPPANCQINAVGNFTIGTLKVGHHSKRESAVEAADAALVCNLHNGILRDRDGRTGSVVANHQFQFDGPPQAGAIYTGGFSICSNGSLAIGGTTQWWQCNSGAFNNLYDEWIGAQCEEIRIQVTFPQTASSSASVAMSSSASVKSASSASASMSMSASESGPVASVQSSLATISGAVSTVSKSAIGPSASFSSTPTGSASRGAQSASPSAGPAPPASQAGEAFGVAKGSMMGAFMVIFGAALIL